MSTKLLIAFVLSCGSGLGGLSARAAEVTVKVDATKNWVGYMNVYDLNTSGGQGQYLWQSAWALADLRAVFYSNISLTLTPNTNVFNPDDPYWAKPDGSGNKWMEANCYVDVGTAFQGRTVTFTGDTISYSLIAPWTTVAVIKEFGSDYSLVEMTTVPLTNGQPFTVQQAIAPGNITQYGLMTTGPNCNPTNLVNAGQVVLALNNPDPFITGEPSNQRVQVGGTATFTVTAVGTGTIQYQWKRNGMNLVNGGNISGATNATLTINNAQFSDSGSYKVAITNAVGSVESATARLRVLTAEEIANALDNPSFERDVVVTNQVPEPWVNFSGVNLVNTNDFYAFDPNWPVQTKDGTNAVQVYNQAEWNGIYQDTPTTPGDIFTADGWFYMSALDQLFGTTSANFEFQFRRGGTVLQQYVSAAVTNGSPLDTWMFLQVTNGVPAGYATMNSTNSYYLVAPPGTDRLRFQITMHNVSYGGLGNVYADVLRVIKKVPVTVTVAISDANVNLSWLTQGATSYQVVYKDNISDAGWTPAGPPMGGDGTVKSVSFPASSARRFYSVLTL